MKYSYLFFIIYTLSSFSHHLNAMEENSHATDQTEIILSSKKRKIEKTLSSPTFTSKQVDDQRLITLFTEMDTSDDNYDISEDNYSDSDDSDATIYPHSDDEILKKTTAAVIENSPSMPQIATPDLDEDEKKLKEAIDLCKSDENGYILSSNGFGGFFKGKVSSSIDYALQETINWEGRPTAKTAMIKGLENLYAIIENNFKKLDALMVDAITETFKTSSLIDIFTILEKNEKRLAVSSLIINNKANIKLSGEYDKQCKAFAEQYTYYSKIMLGIIIDFCKYKIFLKDIVCGDIQEKSFTQSGHKPINLNNIAYQLAVSQHHLTESTKNVIDERNDINKIGKEMREKAITHYSSQLKYLSWVKPAVAYSVQEESIPESRQSEIRKILTDAVNEIVANFNNDRKTQKTTKQSLIEKLQHTETENRKAIILGVLIQNRSNIRLDEKELAKAQKITEESQEFELEILTEAFDFTRASIARINKISCQGNKKEARTTIESGELFNSSMALFKTLKDQVKKSQQPQEIATAKEN